jgi:uncharacterized protein (DUF433 family)
MDKAKSWVTKTPDVCGGEACIRTTRHTVHGLVEWKRLGVSNERLLTMFEPPLTHARVPSGNSTTRRPDRRGPPARTVR